MVKNSFQNKTILITAGSKGIGFAIAKEFLKRGANVGISSRNFENLSKAKKFLLKFSSKDKILTLKHDLNNTKDIKKLFLKTEKFFKSSVDILINNSGGPPPKLISEISNKDLESALNVNLKSAIYASNYAVKEMKKKKWGRIINLTSTTAKEPAKKMCLSNISRAALTSFGKTLSLEAGEFGVTVNTILTGGVLTDRLKNLIRLRIKNTNLSLNKEIEKISNNIPVGRIASPDEFIHLIIFLASEEASYINGTAIPLDGGTSKSIF